MKAQRWVFPIVPKIANRSKHWRTRHGERRRWGKAMLVLRPGPFMAMRAGELVRIRKVRLTIEVWRWNKQDPDNAVASLKPLLDALKQHGWLVDDSETWLEFTLTEHITRARGARRTVITWEALDG